MTTKEYLSQARYLDNRIRSKMMQIESLNDLATQCTTIYSDMPKSPNRDGSRMESAILDILELEEEINQDMRELVALKKEIVNTITSVSNVEYQTLLEERYLCMHSWEQIAVDLNYSMQHVHRMHSAALKMVEIPEPAE